MTIQMKSSEKKTVGIFSALRNWVNRFYITLFNVFALAPLPVIFYYNPFSVVISFYGFLLIFLKHEKLLNVEKANFFQRIFGLIILVGSVFVYHVVTLIYPGVAFYTPANYTVYLFGLFLLFFDFFVLKEAFSSLFLIVAATSSSFIAQWLKPFPKLTANGIATQRNLGNPCQRRRPRTWLGS